VASSTPWCPPAAKAGAQAQAAAAKAARAAQRPGSWKDAGMDGDDAAALGRRDFKQLFDPGRGLCHSARPIQETRQMWTDTLLTHSGPETPCGDYLRRYWQPFMLADELKDLPVALTLMGEQLVAFRDRSGRIGLLGKHCAHRGTSLEFGIPQERGIRCCYHGWQFDVDGTILETPAEPATSTIKNKFKQPAYPVREMHGLLFAYMGPADQMPELPVFDTVVGAEGNKPVPFRFEMPCNWLQVVENACDPIHTSFLHAIVAGQQFASAFKVLPALDFVETPLGFLSQATRKVGDFVFTRSSDIILPNVGQFTGSQNNADAESFRVGCGRTRWVVPIDDHNCHYIGYVYFNILYKPYGELTEEDVGVQRAGVIGQTAERPYHERQREPGDYDAVASQGRIANRGAEHLGTTDRGVVMFRRMLAKEINAATEGKTTEVARRWAEGRPIATYAHEYSLPIPKGFSLGSESELRDFGRHAARIVIEAAGEQREAEALARIRALFGETVA
jgi:nitrite reductase/ring-hydroxylating ferredoxin subunit